ncbi:TPA: hypothetical protein ACH3X2_007374 [Trebouxia sp. C0005]
MAKRFDPSLDPRSEPPHHAVGPVFRSCGLPGSFNSPVPLRMSSATSSLKSFVCDEAIHALAASAQLQALSNHTTLPSAGIAAAASADSLSDAFAKAAAAAPVAVIATDKASEGAKQGGWSHELPARIADTHSGLHHQEPSPAHTTRQRPFSSLRKDSRHLHSQSLGPDHRRHSSRRGKGSRHSGLPLGSPDSLKYPSSRTARHQRSGRASRTRVRSRPAGSETPRRRARASSSPSKGGLHKPNTSPASSEPYGQAMAAIRSRQISKRSTQDSMFPSFLDSFTKRRQMLQTGKSRGAPGKRVLSPKAASPRRSRSDSRLNNSSRHKSRSCIPLASPTRGRPLSRSCRSSKIRKRRPSVSSASPSRHKQEPQKEGGWPVLAEARVTQ